ncbi:MAG: hypothetical protein E7220_02180, partial [Clostridiales bacterium]|nr:hypothetical protein [Clostridiales bacterium]
VTVHSSIQDERTHIEGKDWPDNVTKSFSGKNTFKSAIQKSINTCAVKLQLQVGTDYSMDQLKKFGITTAVDDEKEYANDLNPAALALGAMCQGVKPLEMALAYASFPGEGKVNTPVCYTKVVDRNGEVILEGKSEQTEAMDPGVAWIMRDVLNSVVNANGYIHLDNDIKPGGKTGTTNDRYDIWFDGFTPSYAAALWIGTDNNVEMASGSLAAAHLWGLIMNQIPKALKGSYVSQPSNVIQKGGEYFTKGTENGLSSYQSPEEAKKERERQKKEAYEKWKRQRDKHKVWVVDKKGHYEEKEEVITVVDKEAWDETIEEEVDDYETDPETGEKIKVGSHTETTVIHHPAETHEEVKKTKIWIEEKGHWEYEKGWRDGDFKY